MSYNFLFVFNDGKDKFLKVNKRVARRAFNDGKIIYLLPCKVSPNALNPKEKGFVFPCTIKYNKEENVTNEFGEQFDKAVFYFEHYNCNSELGYYAHYYIRK